MVEQSNLISKQNKLKMIGINSIIENGCLIYSKQASNTSDLGKTEFVIEIYEDNQHISLAEFRCFTGTVFPSMTILTVRGPGRVKTIKFGEKKVSSYDPKNIEEIRIDLDTSRVENMSYMFNGMRGLKRIQFIRFDTSNVREMKMMFSRCTELTSIDLTKFSTPHLKDMSNMFEICKKLKTVDLSTFSMLRVNCIEHMFYSCYELEKIIFPPRKCFKLNELKRFTGVFSGCTLLKELDLSGIEGKLIDNMNGAFECCSSLRSIRLDNLISDGSNVDFSWTFDGCKQLEYLNLRSLRLRYFEDSINAISTEKTLHLVLKEPLTVSEKRGHEQLINYIKEIVHLDLVVEHWNCVE